jgi:hypothetical protein
VQSMPDGSLVTVPLPATVTLSPNVRTKFAATLRAWSIVTWQVPVPEQPPPLQPEKREPEAAVAVNPTTVPSSKTAEQTAPQSIPAGLLVTVPVPEPVRVRVSVQSNSKVALTERVRSIVTWQAPVPEQPWCQPVKTEPAAAVAVNVTRVPSLKSAAQTTPQSIPAGLLVTVPVPEPLRVTVSAATSGAAPASGAARTKASARRRRRCTIGYRPGRVRRSQ